jgi:hypothetical protein
VAPHLTPNKLRRREVAAPLVLVLEGAAVPHGSELRFLALLLPLVFLILYLLLLPWRRGRRRRRRRRRRLLLLRAATARALEDFLDVRSYDAEARRARGLVPAGSLSPRIRHVARANGEEESGEGRGGGLLAPLERKLRKVEQNLQTFASHHAAVGREGGKGSPEPSPEPERWGILETTARHESRREEMWRRVWCVWNSRLVRGATCQSL